MALLPLNIDYVPNVSWIQWLAYTLSIVSIYASLRCIYLIYFHPLAIYPGPRIAAVSNVWYAYHWLSGKYHLAVEQAHRDYGDVVRIAPNELVFLTPEAAVDIHGSHTRNREHFTKTNFSDIGEKEGGVAWERDPVKHREVAKNLHPAFSARSLRAQEPTLQAYVDTFVGKLRAFGHAENGIELRKWMDWLSMDLAADMAYNRELNQVRDLKSSSLLQAMIDVNRFGTIMQITKKFPLLSPFMYFFVPFSVIRSLPNVLKLNRQVVKERIDSLGKTRHLDYFQQLCPDEKAVAVAAKNPKHLEQAAGQLLIAGYDPITNVFYSAIYFLLKNPDKMRLLREEIRGAFDSYDAICPDALVGMKYLNAVIHEDLRLHSPASFGMPRESPGHVVDGRYIPQGTIVQTSNYTLAHSPRYFSLPLEFHPERWLPTDHPLYNAQFANDNKKAFVPFNQGPRACAGSSVAWMQTRLVLAKLVWSFDFEFGKGMGGEEVDWRRDFNLFAMWEKPELWVRFLEVERKV